MKRDITFESAGLKVAGHLYVPDDYKAGERRAAIVTSHPFGGVKEQTAGLYARRLSEKGLIALAFDASYQGESEGEPRHLEDPFARVEDIKSAVTCVSTLDEVDPELIAGTRADTRYFSEEAIQRARKPKELFLVEGASHIDLYDRPEYVEPAVDKLDGFFRQWLT